MVERLAQFYVYHWKNNEQRAGYYGRLCRVLARGAFNSRLIEFVDTKERTLTSGNALRKAKEEG